MNENTLQAILHLAQAKAYLHNENALWMDSKFDSDRGGGFEYYSFEQILDSMMRSLAKIKTNNEDDEKQ